MQILCALAIAIAIAFVPGQATAQAQGSQNDPPRFRIPTVQVTAQKEPEDKQRLPISVTAVSKDTIDAAAIRIVSEAAIFAPNVFFTEATARKLSNAQFRGISSSPSNPAVTTFIDGVPHLHANAANIELLDVDQIEFVRGPQSALFGRNTLGGVVNITSARPSLSRWGGAVSLPFGNHEAFGVRGGVSGPIVTNKLSLGVAVTRLDRAGFTINDITGDDIDSRSSFSGKAQLLWLPNANWETRVIFNGEQARDGDYALNDVGSLRRTPFHAARDFAGRTDRDVYGTTVVVRRATGRILFTSTTGILDWQTEDLTDLDYTPLPLLRRANVEDALQFTQEFRVASGDTAAVSLGETTRLRWQSGVFLFNHAYEQDAINQYSFGVIGPFAASQHSPRAVLDDFGVGLFGQATFTFSDSLDVAAGVRLDYENKSATLDDFFEPLIAPPAHLETDETFSNISPQVSVTYRMQPDKSIYGTVGRGYKAGGFNPTSPVGNEAYGEEFTTNIEGGVKTMWANGRVSVNAAVFSIDWNDLQLNIPNPLIPAQFYIANVGGATSRGVEIEFGARPAAGLDVFTAIGYTSAKFGAGSISNGLNVDGNRIPNTPQYTTSAGAQYTRAIGNTTLRARADAVFYGDFFYNDLNMLAQDAYSLVNVNVGVGGRYWLGELLVRNAFDTRYIPFAFPYPSLAPSGFIGEMGAPRTVSARVGVRF